MTTNVGGFSQDDCIDTTNGPHGSVVEAWSQGFMVGAVVILICVTLASMKRKNLLHKLILSELVIASLHGTFVFVKPPARGWYTSATATLLYISYNLHNVINWIKVKPFLSKWPSLLYIGTVALACPYWIAETYFNFEYNNNLGNFAFRRTRPWEALCREPWWIFTSVYLVYVIRRCYSCGVFELIRISPRFGILMASIALSVAFIITDIVNVATNSSICAGKNPYWKLAFVFKCTADAVFLDDFKSILDQLTARSMQKLRREGGGGAGALPDGSDFGLDITQTSHVIEPATQNQSSFKMRASMQNQPKTEPQSATGHHPKESQSEHIEFRGNTDHTPLRHKTKEWFDEIEPL